ncbi:MAG: DUF3874 domain-containing protein [Bacteroidetes bacterium]|nr:DUF3874 domain-containing protein [Bacteroidota bacterium]
MYTVTVIKNFNKIVEHISILDMFQRIQIGIYGHQIKPLRRFYKAGNMAAYQSNKCQLPAFTPAGTFDDVRNKEHHSGYTHIVVLDLDKLPPDELESIRATINKSEYTFGSFMSPSGAGLKVFVLVSTEAEQHRQAFLSVQQYYETFTGCKIDPSGKDIARLCFVSADEQLYSNTNATIFTPVIETTRKPTAAKPVKVTDSYAACIARAEQKYSFVEGSRHNFVFELALQLRCAGMSEEETLGLLMHDYNFDSKDVSNAVKSVYGYNWPATAETDTTAPQAPSKTKSPKRKATPSNSKKTTVAPVSQEQNDVYDEEYTDNEMDPSSPDPPATKPKSNKKRGLKYNLQAVEDLLKAWYETRYNVITGVVEWRPAKSKKPFIRLDDHHEHTMFRRLNHADQLIPINVLHILLTSDFSRDFNPFQHYFKKLAPWDGVTDYIGQLCDTVKTSDNAYWFFCFRKWFVAWIASMLVDNIINHTVVVLIGAQGAGKTSWMKRLMPRALKNYLGTAALQTDSKDTAIQLAECGMIILDELENLNRKDLASFKELITRPEIRIRRPYGRNFENLPHCASFIASVNFEQVLTDPSGTRRYLCSNVISIDYNHTIDMDKAMAQGLALFKNGFKYWFDQDEIKKLNIKNENFIAKSLEEEMIEIWFRPVTRHEWDTRNQFANGQQIQLMTASEIGAKISEKTRVILADNTIAKIGKILKKLGYERIRKGNNYSYMVRLVNAEAVEKSNHTLDETEAESPITDTNNQHTSQQDDLFTSANNPDMPF